MTGKNKRRQKQNWNLIGIFFFRFLLLFLESTVYVNTNQLKVVAWSALWEKTEPTHLLNG